MTSKQRRDDIWRVRHSKEERTEIVDSSKKENRQWQKKLHIKATSLSQSLHGAFAKTDNSDAFRREYISALPLSQSHHGPKQKASVRGPKSSCTSSISSSLHGSNGSSIFKKQSGSSTCASSGEEYEPLLTENSSSLHKPEKADETEKLDEIWLEIRKLHDIVKNYSMENHRLLCESQKLLKRNNVLSVELQVAHASTQKANHAADALACDLQRTSKQLQATQEILRTFLLQQGTSESDLSTPSLKKKGRSRRRRSNQIGSF